MTDGCLRKFNSFLEFFPSQEREYFVSKISTKSGNWGSILGGKITSSKYPEFIKNARSKIDYSKMRKHSFDFEIPLSIRLCEFIGALIGDGFTNKYGSSCITEFCGDNRFDKSYYEDVIIPIVRDLFKVKAHLRYKDNAMWIRFNSASIHELLTERFEIPKGVKFDKVLIPKEILDSNPAFIAITIRGIFDTDGCVFFDKRKIYKEPYIRIALQLENPPLIRQTYRELLKLGVKAHLLKDNRRIQINGKEAVKGYLEKVGFSNKRHIDRIRQNSPNLLTVP